MRVAVLLLGLAMFPVVSMAATRAEQREAANLVKKAGRLYEGGKYLEAAAALEKAQSLDPHPRILYNIARAYDQAGELQKALDNYQRYIGSSEGTDPTLLKRSSLSVDRLRGLLAQQNEARERSEAERARLEQERREAEARAESEARAKRDAEEAAQQRRRERVLGDQVSYDRSKMAAWVTAGVGAVALGTGGFFGFQAYQTGIAADGPFRTASAAGPTADDQGKVFYEQQAKQQALIADIAYGVGIVAAVTSVILWPKQDRPQLASFTVGPTGALVEVKF